MKPFLFMKRSDSCGWNVLLLALALAGCQPRPGESGARQDAVEIGPKYSPHKGLFVPDDTRQSLGLKIVEVTEQTVPAALEVPLCVYQHSANTSLASGTVTPEQAKALKPGQAVQVLTGDGRKLSAKIIRVSGQLQKAIGLAEALVAVPNPGEPIAVGTFLQARVTLDSSENVVTIPRAALLECSDGSSVYTVSGDYLVRTPVKVGAANADLVEITDGLYPGDQVVIQPVMSLWMTELAAVKGGQACCVQPPKGK
jgi:multidrug efflux pump subunit AcrA (membrane-fusion protein)